MHVFSEQLCHPPARPFPPLRSQIFHFSSVAYPIDEGHFKGRMQWYGDPARSDASIRLLNASLGDNGTYSCAVRNPPDIQGLPSNTVLTVSPKSEKRTERLANMNLKAKSESGSLAEVNPRRLLLFPSQERACTSRTWPCCSSSSSCRRR